MKNNLFGACVIALGVALAGLFVDLGIHHFADKDRAVVVKGLSTREVEADHVVWPLDFTVQSNDLQELLEKRERVMNQVIDMLLKKGFERADIQMGETHVNDQWDGYYEHRPEYHYSLSSTLVVSTDKVTLVNENKNSLSELIAKGIIINSHDWNIDYQYNGLSELKPSMIEEATKNARAVAQKFADDSQSHLGGIKSAYQGQFSIESDEYSPWKKHVRVVTTVEYFLD